MTRTTNPRQFGSRLDAIVSDWNLGFRIDPANVWLLGLQCSTNGGFLPDNWNVDKAVR